MFFNAILAGCEVCTLCTLSYPSDSWSFFSSNRFPSTLNKATWESDRIWTGKFSMDKQFSWSRNVLRFGHLARSALTFFICCEEIVLQNCNCYIVQIYTWFWFKISSTTWSPLMPSGTSVIRFFDKSKTLKNLREAKPAGNTVMVLPLKRRKITRFNYILHKYITFID